jgi:hypothetical protein
MKAEAVIPSRSNGSGLGLTTRRLYKEHDKVEQFVGRRGTIAATRDEFFVTLIVMGRGDAA